MLEQAGYIGPGRDRQRKAETGSDMLGHWAARVYRTCQGQAEKRETIRDMLGQAGHIMQCLTGIGREKQIYVRAGTAWADRKIRCIQEHAWAGSSK
jgi:hypothetical protein